MKLALSPAMHEGGLPRLGGRVIFAYRAAWFLLAAAAVIVLGVSVGQPIHPAVLVLRLIKAAVVVAVCAILLRRRATDPVAALLSLAFLTWTITSSFDFATTDLLPQLLDRVRFLLFALALLLFPEGNWRPRWTRHVAAASIAVFLLGMVETVSLAPTRMFLPLAIGCVLAAIASLMSRFRTAPSETVRQQLKWVALGLVTGVGLILAARAGASLSSASPALQPMPILWEALFQLGIVAVAVGFLVSLLRYRLFDAEAAISRSAALAGLTIALVATFAGTEATIEWVGQQYLGMGIGDVSAAMAAAVAAVLLTPLHNRISDWAENRFQRDLICLKKELPGILADLAASASPREIGMTILPRINAAVHATRSALIVGTKVIAVAGTNASAIRPWLRESLSGSMRPSDRAVDDPVFPVRLALHDSFSGRAAWLVLGPRPDGSLYGREDLDALDTIGPAIRHALSWALSRERSRAVSRRKWQAMRNEIAALNHRIGCG